MTPASWFQRLLQPLLPTTCALCLQTGQVGWPLCTACERALPPAQAACARCASPLLLPEQQTLISPPLLATSISSTSSISPEPPPVCGTCLRQPPPFRETVVAWPYQFPINHFVMQLKFSHQRQYGALLGNLFAEKLRQHYQPTEQQPLNQPLPEAIIPMPLHHERFRTRGYNQAELIAQAIATQFKMPLLTDLVSRAKATLAQAQLPAKARASNVRHAFCFHPPQTPLPYQHLALVDDIVTTGATTRELATLLKQHGYTISLWCCAKAYLRHSPSRPSLHN